MVSYLTEDSFLLELNKARCLEGTLQQNKDVFAWTHFDIPEIHPLIASHQLNILPSSRRIRQKVRWFHPDRQRIIQDEIDKLLATEFIKEVEYPDCFPLPWIDQIVDSTVEHGMLSFLDAFSGYHQIPMSPADEEKTVFITPHKLYCYKVMPFGLKNAGATYQRLMTKIFKPLIGHIVEGASATRWTEDYQSAFEEIKHYLTQPPILSSPQPDEDKEQRLVYYISKAMADMETICSKMEQTALALRSAAQKLHSYFQAHPIVVLTNQPLKRQVMVDFIVEVPQEPSRLKEPGKNGWLTSHVDGAF
ncbi:Transposon Ty3-I Gag-Pol polyprotein [Vitis vinifera]|uniref:Transposon Ty3-I Gag-Pol polyprotein n=1 Tax=Vitis vinifera TaxID=29760 RepID=A0A438DJQ5_VITVI|nr:Transposon Ty3-I Gag-Pol polyprotein [Vitis vinifera]